MASELHKEHADMTTIEIREKDNLELIHEFEGKISALKDSQENTRVERLKATLQETIKDFWQNHQAWIRYVHRTMDHCIMD